MLLTTASHSMTGSPGTASPPRWAHVSHTWIHAGTAQIRILRWVHVSATVLYTKTEGGFGMCVTSHLLYGINYSYYYLFIIAWISTAKLTVSQPNAVKWANVRLYNGGMQTSQHLSLHFNVLRTVIFYNTQNVSLSVSLSTISSQTIRRWANKIGTQVHLRSLKVLSYIRHYDVIMLPNSYPAKLTLLKKNSNNY